jgi:uncharacterized protein YegL
MSVNIYPNITLDGNDYENVVVADVTYEDDTEPKVKSQRDSEGSSYQQTSSHREIIFCIDCSGSMEATLPMVKKSLLSFRDIIIDGIPILSKETALRHHSNIRLITFNAQVKEVWSSDASNNSIFEDAVMGLFAIGSTNLGDALELSLSKVSQHRATWIVVLTDGKSNHGPYQTKESFDKFAKKIPENVKIIPLGYGTEFDVDILCSLGAYTYLEDIEYIPSVIGSLAYEFMFSWGFNSKFEGPFIKNIIGTPKIGCIYKDRSYIYAFTTFLEAPKELILTYTHISKDGLKQKSIIYPIGLLVNPSKKIIKAYYASVYADILMNIHRSSTSIDLSQAMSKLESWDNEESFEYKESLLRLFKLTKESIGKKELHMRMCSYGISVTAQLSYTDPVTQSPMMKQFAQLSVNRSRDYN